MTKKEFLVKYRPSELARLGKYIEMANDRGNPRSIVPEKEREFYLTMTGELLSLLSAEGKEKNK